MWVIMMLRRLTTLGLAVVVSLFWLHASCADALHVVKSNPAAGTVIDATRNLYEVLFDGQLDPSHSRLSIMRDNQVVETLYPSLDAAPGVLFARGPRLTPGDYKL